MTCDVRTALTLTVNRGEQYIVLQYIEGMEGRVEGIAILQ